MKPAAFVYHCPANLEEALSLRRKYGDEGTVLAGGQSLVPMMNMRLARPSHIIDINQCHEMDYVREQEELLFIGALTRQRVAETSPLVRALCPLLAEGLRHVGHLPIRRRGTVGGSVAHADPSAEIPCVIAALEGKLRIDSASNGKVLSADEFFLAYMTTALQPNELLVEIQLPKLDPAAGWAYLEFARRQGDFGIVGIASALALDGERIRDAWLGMAGVGGGPIKARKAEAALRGNSPDGELFVHAAELAAEECDPNSDLRASAEYRRELVKVFVRRALTESLERARQKGNGEK
jgi:CO/xanthine dehydrogenase FAD-binding subunit